MSGDTAEAAGTGGPTWEDFLAEISEEFWTLFPKSFADAGHRDLCHPMCHQNLMAAVRVAIDRAWAQHLAGGPVAVRVADDFLTCGGCGDDVWPGEGVYPRPTGGDAVLCEVCAVRDRIALERAAAPKRQVGQR